MIERLAGNKVTVLFSSHDMEEVSRIADRLILMDNGQIIAEGQPEDLLQQYHAEKLEDLYLQLTDNA